MRYITILSNQMVKVYFNVAFGKCTPYEAKIAMDYLCTLRTKILKHYERLGRL
jgi:hypothetical protein